MAETFTGNLTGSAGSRLVIRDAELVPATTPDTPPPTPLPPPHGRRRVMWHHGWNGPAISSWPPDVRASLTTVCLAVCQSATPNAKPGQETGKITDPPGVTRSEVLGLVADGVDVLIGIGGSGQDKLHVVTPANVAELVASVLSIRDRFGITGICWDLEGTPGGSWTIEAVVAASRALVAAGMRVAIWSATYGGRREAWGAVARALGTDLDHWQRALYDFPEAGDGRLTGITTGALADLRPYLARDDQLVLCFAPIGSLSRTPAGVAVDAYAAARKASPLAGLAVFEDYRDSAQSWLMLRGLVKV